MVGTIFLRKLCLPGSDNALWVIFEDEGWGYEKKDCIY